MKTGIHPETKETMIRCACGAEFEVKSTAEDLRVEVCSSCHPFYTGKRMRASLGGRIERFRKKYGMGEEESTEEDA